MWSAWRSCSVSEFLPATTASSTATTCRGALTVKSCGSAEPSVPVLTPLPPSPPVFPQCGATVLALYDGQSLVPEVHQGQRCGVILDQSCFYAEQGGQSHDHGYLTKEGLPVREQRTGKCGTCSSEA